MAQGPKRTVGALRNANVLQASWVESLKIGQEQAVDPAKISAVKRTFWIEERW
jgi:hypothetical protein